jgi:multicomponent Na+:H+ antiporter subunit A
VAGGALRRKAFLIGGIGPLAALLWGAWHAWDVLDGGFVHESIDWVPALGLGIDLRFDAFSLLMLLLVSGIGTLVFAYALGYFGDTAHAGRLAGILTLFAGAMLGLVLSDNLLLLYVCWELTSVTSYLLIGGDGRDSAARAAALHALLVTSLGGLAMLAGFVLLGQQAGTYQMSELLADPPTGPLVATALVLVLVGAFTKSAQYPFHGWLPAAMVAPTPVSAYLHSAAMVKAGIYLVARFAPVFAAVGVWRPLVVAVGLVTMVAGGLRALRRDDLKQLLAFGTVSQLGFLMVLLGIGQPAATAAGCALLLAHGLFKAALFMVVGIVDHQAHTRNMRELPPLGAGWRPTKVVAVLSAASMAALPPLAGFLAKESAYEAFVHGGVGDRLVLAGIMVGSILTVAYSSRLVAGLLRPELLTPPRPVRAAAPAPTLSFLAPAIVLAVATVVLGVVPGVFSELVGSGARALDGVASADLYLWHGFTLPLALSALTVLAGAALFVARRRVAAVQAALAPSWSTTDAYDAAVRGLTRAAGVTTGVVQSGSLPIYVAVIMLTAAVVPGLGLVLGSWWPGWPDLVGVAVYVPVAALLIGGAVAATFATRRFTAALLLGSVGYGMALLFVVQGAPDLALTQFAVETLSVVLFLLVLRRLPDRFERRTPALGHALRIGVSAAAGVFVFAMAIAAAGARTEDPVSVAMTRQALPDGGGRNIVNVILVDFRGLDTLGEITVLVVAAIGATALARAGRRPTGAPHKDQA